jgi:hypothetical protein
MVGRVRARCQLFAGLHRPRVDENQAAFLEVASVWCRARSRFEVGVASLFTAQLGNILRETHSGEAGREPRAERWLGFAFVPDRVAEDLADFLLSAVTMTACAALKLGLYVVVEMSDQELSHGDMISKID